MSGYGLRTDYQRELCLVYICPSLDHSYGAVSCFRVGAAGAAASTATRIDVPLFPPTHTQVRLHHLFWGTNLHLKMMYEFYQNWVPIMSCYGNSKWKITNDSHTYINMINTNILIIFMAFLHSRWTYEGQSNTQSDYELITQMRISKSITIWKINILIQRLGASLAEQLLLPLAPSLPAASVLGWADWISWEGDGSMYWWCPGPLPLPTGSQWQQHTQTSVPYTVLIPQYYTLHPPLLLQTLLQCILCTGSLCICHGACNRLGGNVRVALGLGPRTNFQTYLYVI